MAAIYTESEKRPGHYSVRVGPRDISRVMNIQWITHAEALAIKAVPAPSGGGSTEMWHDLRTASSPIIELLIDLNPLKSRLLAHKQRDSLGDFEVLEAFRKNDNTAIKAALYNRRSETYWFMTGTNVEPAEKHTKAVESGWYVFTTHLTAPPEFWRKLRERI
jgi:hypothetical protein